MRGMPVAIPISAELLLLFPTVMLSKEMSVSSPLWDLLFSHQMNHREEHGEILKLQNYFMELLDLHGEGAFRGCLIAWLKYSSPNFTALTMNLMTDQTSGLNYIKQQR